MPVFALLTRLSPGSLKSPHTLEELERRVVERIRRECPKVKWRVNFAVIGPWDYLDILDAPDIDTAAKVSTIIRTFGHAHTELWPLVDWPKFKKMIRALPGADK